MSARNRGAAHIGIIWFVVALIVCLGALAATAVQLGHVSDLEKDLVAAREAEKKAEEQAQAHRQDLAKLAAAVGFNDANTAHSPPNADAAASALEALRTSFPTISGDVKTLQAAIPRVTEAYGARGEKIATLENQVKSLESDLQASRDALASTTRQKDEEIATQRRSLDDTNAKFTAQVAQQDSQVQTLRQQNRDLDQQVREAKAAGEKREGELQREIATLSGRVGEMGKKLETITKEPDRPDGTILSVSNELPIAYVDLGTKHRLVRGVRFQVLNRAGGAAKVKGWVEVEDVERDQARVRIFDVADRFDPVVPGDRIANPLYDPNAEKMVVLHGRFTGRLSKPEVAMLLGGVGVKVQEKVDRTTDFMVLGSEEVAMLEGTGKPLSETDEYKQAEAFGVQIVPLKAVETFFRF